MDISWLRYQFELFGLACDIFANAPPAILVDPQTPNEGYLAQNWEQFGIMISYGSQSGLDQILALKLQTGDQATIVTPRSKIDFHQKTAELIKIEIIPSPPAIGFRHSVTGLETIQSSSGEPYSLKLIGTNHRNTPLTIEFQSQIGRTISFHQIETHFFNSFSFND